MLSWSPAGRLQCETKGELPVGQHIPEPAHPGKSQASYVDYKQCAFGFVLFVGTERGAVVYRLIPAVWLHHWRILVNSNVWMGAVDGCLSIILLDKHCVSNTKVSSSACFCKSGSIEISSSRPHPLLAKIWICFCTNVSAHSLYRTHRHRLVAQSHNLSCFLYCKSRTLSVTVHWLSFKCSDCCSEVKDMDEIQY